MTEEEISEEIKKKETLTKPKYFCHSCRCYVGVYFQGGIMTCGNCGNKNDECTNYGFRVEVIK